MKSNWFPVMLGIVTFLAIMQPSSTQPPVAAVTETADCWTGASINQAPIDSNGLMIRYGHALISNTAYYLGPKGKVALVSNGMNCQNCHLEAGTKPWGNNFGAVASTYPKYRDRSGSIESIEKKINDCIERSLNGKAIANNSKEMKAMVAYVSWLGDDISKGNKPKGTGIMQLEYLSRAADPVKGKSIYITTCDRCHGANGEGQASTNIAGYTYPPLWGANSYNSGAGLYRLSKLAGYVKNNMPNTVNYHSAELTDEQAWDVAAFINSQPRPVKDISKDWPDISTKPFDHPFGPYSDSFSEAQHKYGPFTEIIKKP